jgi:hypothetical protein
MEDLEIIESAKRYLTFWSTPNSYIQTEPSVEASLKENEVEQ